MNHDAIAHCERLIQRAKLELAKREGSSYRANEIRRRIATLEIVRAAHLATQGRQDAA